ncbi:Flavonoid 3'-monooxygenase [Arachis hypogaea]|nr:Flavonoid 3'-monooxygenase [Arachis hypogaea]
MLLIIAFFIISIITWVLFFRPSKAQGNLPPGPPGLPIFGNLFSLDPELHTYFAGLARTYGPIFKLQLGGKLGIVITSPTVACQVLKDHDTVFANRDVPAAGRAATYGGSDIVWTPYGPEWRMLRKVCVMKMLSNHTLDSVYELRRNEMTALLGKPNVSDFFPALARFDLQGVEKQMHALVPRFDGIFERMIKKRVKEGNKKSTDFLQFLLNLKDEGDSKTPLTMVQLKSLLMDMVVGGSDTSSNTIEFAMAEMINKPEIMKIVQEELEAVVGRDNIVEESHIHKLPYLRAVMKETLRLHPALPLLVPHCPSETTTVGGYTIPKGSRVFVNVWAIHRDPSIWDKPLEFNPTRFLEDGEAKWDFSGSDFSYFPFGSGRRICAGIAMAERTVLYSLATLLHSFDWRIPEREKFDVSEKFGIVLKKKVPLIAIPIPRLSNPDLYK